MTTVLEDSLPRVMNYVDNQKFSEAVHAYNLKRKIAEENNNPIPRVPEYIGKCFILMSEGMAQKPNFNRYTYKDEMIADGIENCLRYIANYDIEKETRTGNANAFFYFSQIIFYAFVRRIKKEKKQTELKNELVLSSNIDFFITFINEESLDGEEEYHHYLENNVHKKISNI
jgi:hypothetical protein